MTENGSASERDMLQFPCVCTPRHAHTWISDVRENRDVLWQHGDDAEVIVRTQ